MQPTVRAAAVLVEDGRILLVRQRVSAARQWSLPGGGLEFGETLQDCVVREVREETGLEVAVERLLYVCDRIEGDRHVVHITFAVQRVGGELRNSARVRMVALASLVECGFSERFRDLVEAGFPEAGSYRGRVSSIGL